MGRTWLRAAAMAAVLPVLALMAPAARADTIEAGAVGGPTATMWLFYVGFDQGFFKKHNRQGRKDKKQRRSILAKRDR